MDRCINIVLFIYFLTKPFFQFDFENRIHGANFLAYPPVVAGGNRANTLHYINNNQIIKVTVPSHTMKCISPSAEDALQFRVLLEF